MELQAEERELTPAAVEISYLTTAILDYYDATGSSPAEEGDEWKKLDPEKYLTKGIEIPEDLDREIKKAFMVQIKKFQK
jgi:hypothetical protein